MNWTGGRLQQSKRGQRGGLTLAQKAYFSKAKARRSQELAERSKLAAEVENIGRVMFRGMHTGFKRRRESEAEDEDHCESGSQSEESNMDSNEGDEDRDRERRDELSDEKNGKVVSDESGDDDGQLERAKRRRKFDFARARRHLLKDPEWLSLGDRRELQRRPSVAELNRSSRKTGEGDRVAKRRDRRGGHGGILSSRSRADGTELRTGKRNRDR